MFVLVVQMMMMNIWYKVQSANICSAVCMVLIHSGLAKPMVLS
jgi:hypothetical protein